MTPDDIKQRFPALRGVEQNDLAVFLDSVNVSEIPAGTNIITPGEDSSVLYLIYDGLVRVSLESEEECTVLGDFGKGQWIGEMGMIQPASAVAMATTIADCVVIQLSHADFMALRRRCPTLTSVLLQVFSNDLAGRFRSTMQFIDSGVAESNVEKTSHAWLIEAAKRVMGIAARAGA